MSLFGKPGMTQTHHSCYSPIPLALAKKIEVLSINMALTRVKIDFLAGGNLEDCHVEETKMMFDAATELDFQSHFYKELSAFVREWKMATPMKIKVLYQMGTLTDPNTAIHVSIDGIESIFNKPII